MPEKQPNTQQESSRDEDAAAQDSNPENREGTSSKSVFMSVLAAIFGIQSDKNRRRDFEKGRPTDYIVVGIVVVLAILIGMIVLVNIIISNAT